ncbi:MAG: prenyltransferase/squalene oxidase repeat-containing protein [Planctomycetota bacterium]
MVVAILGPATFFSSTHVWAVTPESPEVRKMIERGLQSLDGHSETRLGGLCLIALAFIKDGASPDNPHVLAAVEACQNTTSQQMTNTDMYSNGLAIIFLAELDAAKHKSKISQFAGVLSNRQKPHGGWGYGAYRSGDTSQTQYAALCIWELLQVGLPPSVNKVDACANWLLRTQDPSGAWGYQGKDPGNFELVDQTGVTASMLAAGMGSTLIFGNVLGLTKPGGGTEVTEDAEEASSVLKRVEPEGKNRVRTMSGSAVSRERMMSAISRGQAWFDKNFSAALIEDAEYPSYMLYSLERYKSFEELLSGVPEEEPEWYQMGYKYLKEEQLPEGGWKGKSGQPCSTAFAVLFLLRSTQKSIKANMGQGTLVGGRGLAANLSRMKMRQGRLVTEEKPTEIDQFLGMLDGAGSEDLEALVNDPTALQVSNVSPDEARRLQQLVKSGDPAGRILAVRALSKMRSLDFAPTLIYALTDPDKRVVREARDGLRFVSRKFKGFGLDDNFNDSQRFNAIDRWKTWYRTVRPSAPPLP